MIKLSEKNSLDVYIQIKRLLKAAKLCVILNVLCLSFFKHSLLFMLKTTIFAKIFFTTIFTGLFTLLKISLNISPKYDARYIFRI